MKVKSLLIFLKRPNKLIKVLGAKGFLKWMSDYNYLRLVYRAETGNKLNLKNPKKYSEKLQWLKLYDRKPKYVSYVDKYEVRKHVSKTIGEEYLNPLLAVYQRVEEIEWDKLPNKFVLKCTHGSSSNIICTDKNQLNIREAEKKLKKWMNRNWYWLGREWEYKKVNPQIIVEKFIEGENGKTPVDYKVFCFNGEPKLIQVIDGRFDITVFSDFYDIHWNKTNLGFSDAQHKTSTVPPPKNYEVMLNIAKTLSEDLSFARIDFYDQGGDLFFGEITFYPKSGFGIFNDIKDDYKLGSWMDL
ncbi:ATP-grasp fold amidoligase family protein [Salimicrobium jeotgali]|uniref:ATP-grasp fold amidoligase family protein n=1 Tax=Salimicrobium jeotgali TaxID=1230341 RepID=UPI001CA5EFCB|nr:ATP-grasp fold amidoligase family protein [Salimicrobium jeotgali]